IDATDRRLHPNVIHFARKLRTNQTDAERRLWSRRRRRQRAGFKVRRQHPFGIHVCDFICLEARVIVELDGSQHLEQAPHDQHRDAALRASGFRTLRFWNGDVLSRTDTVVETIYEALNRKNMDGRFD
ncbi:MAG: endonuclease domain-containing protein, partial [Bradyrhizobium sp.]